MLREQARKRLTKKAKKGFRGYPVATVALREAPLAGATHETLSLRLGP